MATVKKCRNSLEIRARQTSAELLVNSLLADWAHLRLTRADPGLTQGSRLTNLWADRGLIKHRAAPAGLDDTLSLTLFLFLNYLYQSRPG